MLVLSRRIGESICIGNDITINIVKVSGNRVRVGIDAPKDVEILRGELTHWKECEEELQPSLASVGAEPEYYV